MSQADPTRRFTNRVENYLKYRPSYPPEIVDFLRSDLGLNRTSVIADIGSGTGMLTCLFLENGNSVFAVEPNKEMREAAERLLNEYPGFKSVAAAAESTTLPGLSVDFIIAGQAFHWFDRQQSKREFQRILKPEGWVVLLWNDRRVSSPFEVSYENLLLKFGTDYRKVDHRNISEEILGEFFAPRGFRSKVFDNHQLFDLQGLKGRLLSSSYVPAQGDPNYDLMIQELSHLYQEHSAGGRIRIEYDTRLFCGQLS